MRVQPTHHNQIALFALLGSISLGGCLSNQQSADTDPAPTATQPDEPTVVADWAALPHGEWPQIVLTNYAEFDGHTSLEGASGFLVKNRDGQVFAATVLHLIGAAGSVEPDVKLSELDDKLLGWFMYPRTLSDNHINISAVGMSSMRNQKPNWFGNVATDDWLLLKIESTDSLPATPLCMRKRPAAVGETVYLIGCPYSEEACSQNVYTGKVTQRDGNTFRYNLDPPVDLRGFSGAPIVDQNGSVVGVMSVNFQPKTYGENYLEGGGVDAALVYDCLENPD